MKNTLLAAICMMTVFSSCTKDDNNGKNLSTPSDYLKNGTWRVVSYFDTTVSASSGIEETYYNDLYSTMEDCKKDDYTRFDSNDSVYFDNGPTKCHDDQPQVKSSKWELLNNDTQLRMAEYGGYGVYDIVELNEHRLRIYYKYGDGTYTSSGVISYSH